MAAAFLTLTGVYTGTAVDALTDVATGETVCGLGSIVTFPATAGQTHRIAVDRFDGECDRGRPGQRHAQRHGRA